MSDTSTKKNKDVKETTRAPKKRAGGLILRILSVNMLPLIVLVVGLLSLGRYQQNLINEHLNTLQEQAYNFAVAIEGPRDNDRLDPEMAKRTIRKLADQRADIRIRLLDHKGRVVADSHQLSGPGGIVQIDTLDPPKTNLSISAVIAYLGTKLLELLPSFTDLATFPVELNKPEAYPDILRALQGQASATAWSKGSRGLALTAAAPVFKNNKTAGVVFLTNDGGNIDIAMDRVRLDVLTATMAALSMTIFMSVYLATIIGQPVRKLARAAEEIRMSKGKDVMIPDMSAREDEIGELSMALRDMTDALRDRMDSIESFAADVSHEIKNPLTSLRSAVETVVKVKSSKDRQKLLEIILHDVERLDRLITDISKASRLDAELSRDEFNIVDLRTLIERLVDAHKNPMERTGVQTAELPIKLEIPRNKEIKTLGNESRLAQVFENLISNALSFSPEKGVVTIRILPGKDQIIIEVEDEGKGIPENKLDAIFERFYSERPKTEAYGRHSGLGLSISRQIIEAHGGEIYAENIQMNGDVQGACFTVILQTA